MIDRILPNLDSGIKKNIIETQQSFSEMAKRNRHWNTFFSTLGAIGGFAIGAGIGAILGLGIPGMLVGGGALAPIGASLGDDIANALGLTKSKDEIGRIADNFGKYVGLMANVSNKIEEKKLALQGIDKDTPKFKEISESYDAEITKAKEKARGFAETVGLKGEEGLGEGTKEIIGYTKGMIEGFKSLAPEDRDKFIKRLKETEESTSKLSALYAASTFGSLAGFSADEKTAAERIIREAGIKPDEAGSYISSAITRSMISEGMQKATTLLSDENLGRFRAHAGMGPYSSVAYESAKEARKLLDENKEILKKDKLSESDLRTLKENSDKITNTLNQYQPEVALQKLSSVIEGAGIHTTPAKFRDEFMSVFNKFQAGLSTLKGPEREQFEAKIPGIIMEAERAYAQVEQSTMLKNMPSLRAPLSYGLSVGSLMSLLTPENRQGYAKLLEKELDEA